MLQTKYNIAPNPEIIGFQSQLNVATAGSFAELLSGNLCLGCASVHMCTPTLTHSTNLGGVYCKNNLRTAV